MLKRILLVVSLGVLLATMALANTGCASSSGFTSMIAKVPEDTTSLKYVNVKALRSDADLDNLYDAWKASVSSGLEVLNINYSDVNVFTHGSSVDRRFTLLVGKFDLDKVREELDDRGYDEGEYKGVEVWEKEVGLGSVLESRVALMGNMVIAGNEDGVEGCISVMKSGSSSWLSDSDVNDVANRLPGGVYVDMQEQELASLFIKGLEVYGLSAKKLDADTLKMAGVAKFDSENHADDADGAIKNQMELQQFNKVDISQKGDFLEASAELDIDKAESLF
jgi:hypothetical protein